MFCPGNSKPELGFTAYRFGAVVLIYHPVQVNSPVLQKCRKNPTLKARKSLDTFRSNSILVMMRLRGAVCDVNDKDQPITNIRGKKRVAGVISNATGAESSIRDLVYQQLHEKMICNMSAKKEAERKHHKCESKVCASSFHFAKIGVPWPGRG